MSATCPGGGAALASPQFRVRVGGSAGIAAARTLATRGARIAVVEGDSRWEGCASYAAACPPRCCCMRRGGRAGVCPVLCPARNPDQLDPAQRAVAAGHRPGCGGGVGVRPVGGGNRYPHRNPSARGSVSGKGKAGAVRAGRADLCSTTMIFPVGKIVVAIQSLEACLPLRKHAA